MCNSCRSQDNWQVASATVKNAGTETVRYVDAYYGHTVTIEPGEEKHIYIRYTPPRS